MTDPNTPGPDRREVHGWKEIAEYLGVGVRAAQYYEQKNQLPIQRKPGLKGHVWATIADLDRWKAGGQSAAPVTLEGDSPALEEVEDLVKPQRRTMSRVAWMLIALVGFGVTAFLLAARGTLPFRTGRLVDFRVEGRMLTAVGEQGEPLWTHLFDTPNFEAHYQGNSKVAHGWIGDLDGDGEDELLFNAIPVHWQEHPPFLVCFDGRGREKWRFTAGHAVRDGSGDVMEPPYGTGAILAFPRGNAGETRIAISSPHYIGQANQVAFLDGGGKLRGEYWHPGHLLHLGKAALNGQPGEKLLAAGVNNGEHRATIIVLDPWKTTGITARADSADGRFDLVGMDKANEDAIILFPRSCVSLGKPYTRVSVIRVTPHRIVAEVNEGPSEDNDIPLVYEFDYNLSVQNLVPANYYYKQQHAELERTNRVHHRLTEAEFHELASKVEIRR